MRCFVLVHGGRHGGWCWRKVRPRLERAGHEVHAPTLTGLGERQHLARPNVDLDTHTRDVLGVIEYEDLRDVVLVGHSYGGMVISAVADAAPERLAHLVFFDALVPRSGETVLDLMTPSLPAQLRELVRTEGDGWRLPSAAVRPEDYGVTDPDDVAWVRSKLTDQPFASYTQPIRLTGRGDAVPRSFVACTAPGGLLSTEPRKRAEAAGWPIFEVSTGHDAMITEPAAVADILLAVMDGAATRG
jgi:pimeloyl-ACP methyl ester carboxylesterase